MLSGARAGHGFSLIELLVAMAILGLLMAAAGPGFSEWIANSRVRTTAESIQNGLMLAKAEAVRRNAKVQFVMTDSAPTVANIDAITASTTGSGWLVRKYRATGTYVSADFIQGRSIAEGGTNTTVTAGQSSFVFSGIARLSPIPGATVNVNVSGSGATRPLRITVTQGSAIRMCDPALSIATSTMGC
ncbi:MAG: GspH/FimT family pseudopilin [Telluria sp.]